MAEPKPRISTVSSDTRRDEDDQVASQTSLTRPAPLPPLFAGHYIVGLPAILRNGLLSLSLGDKLCDLIIRAGDREFIAHTAVVFSQSEPLSSCCKVDKDPTIVVDYPYSIEVSLGEASVEALEALLFAIYLRRPDSSLLSDPTQLSVQIAQRRLVTLSDALIFACAAKAHAACEIILHYLAKAMLESLAERPHVRLEFVRTITKLWDHATRPGEENMLAETKRVVKATCVEVAIFHRRQLEKEQEFQTTLKVNGFGRHFERLVKSAKEKASERICMCARCKKANQYNERAIVKCLKRAERSAMCMALAWELNLCQA